MARGTFWVVFLSFLIPVGCVSHKETEARLATLEQKSTALEAQLQSLNVDVFALQTSAANFKTAVSDPADPSGYQRLDSAGGTFLVSIENVTPYVDGFRVRRHFGNPSSARFDGFKLKAKWGPRFDATKTKFTDWLASLRTKELTLTDSLRPGSWNPISFVLSPATAQGFGYLELSMETNTVSLAR